MRDLVSKCKEKKIGIRNRSINKQMKMEGKMKKILIVGMLVMLFSSVALKPIE